MLLSLLHILVFDVASLDSFENFAQQICEKKNSLRAELFHLLLILLGVAKSKFGAFDLFQQFLHSFIDFSFGESVLDDLVSSVAGGGVDK